MAWKGGGCRLADLYDQMRAAENRLTEIEIELAGLGERKIGPEQVSAALRQFADLVKCLSLPESCALLDLLVAGVAFYQLKGTVAISFHSSGIKTLTEQIS